MWLPWEWDEEAGNRAEDEDEEAEDEEGEDGWCAE